MRFDFFEYLTSVTGITSLAAASLLVTKKYDLAAVTFTALSLGAAGVLWERYSRKAGAPLDLKVFSKRRLPEQEEIDFILSHSPFPFLAVLSYLLARKRS
jgi:hypothetical protein